MIIKKEFWFGFFSKKFKNYSKKGWDFFRKKASNFQN